MQPNLSPLLAAGKRLVQTINMHARKFWRSHRGMGAMTVTVAMAILAVALFLAGRWSAAVPAATQKALADMRLEITQQQQLLAQSRRDQEMDINALAARLAELQAASTRLDALGERLVSLGQLDPEEFDFGKPPPVGGPEMPVNDGRASAADVGGAIDRLSQYLQLQATRLDALQLLLLDRNLDSERTPAGWPVSSGWISSGFGERNDPFTGKRTRHDGLDFAGTRGTDILGVASGVVIWAGAKQGFGKTLEIAHGNGYVTRYAHNEELLVAAGDRITAGQVIARMGSSGRASSPHVHFEVLHKGQAVNPHQFVKQER